MGPAEARERATVAHQQWQTALWALRLLLSLIGFPLSLIRTISGCLPRYPKCPILTCTSTGAHRKNLTPVFA